jgi:cytochrome c553
MARRISAAALVVWMGVIAVGLAAAQDAAPTKSTMAGIYTAAQADKGANTFSSICSGCHKASQHSGDPFKVRWAGKPLFELYDTIKATMPDDNPGTLTAAESIQVVAYLLKINGMPSGDAELAADDAVLKTYRIDLPAKLAAAHDRDPR